MLKLIFVLLLAALPLHHAAAQAERYGFGEGCRGFFIVELNAALERKLGGSARIPGSPDVFDKATAANIDLFCRQEKISGHAPGRVTAREYEALGLKWPSDISRCFQLINEWEGTELKLEGPSESEDAFPTVTFGIIGFTSHDGSLQWFLYNANQMLHGGLSETIQAHLGKSGRETFDRLIAIGRLCHDQSTDPPMTGPNQDFVAWALESPMGNPRPEIRRAFYAFGAIPGFLDVQLDLCKERAWDNEAKTGYLPMLFPPPHIPSLQAKFLALEMTVLTNGPDAAQRRILAQTPFTNEHQRMLQILDAMRHSKITMAEMSDVMEREGCIVRGHGMVHEDYYDLSAYALMPY